MTDFSKIAATSQAAGFQYYSVENFSFTKSGLFVPKVSGGVYSHDTSSFSLPKGTTDLVMTNVLMNVSVTDAVGDYHFANSGVTGTRTVGSSGGFPIVYGYNIYISSDANNLIFTIDVGNPSAVNDVNTESITISGKVFFYLAPF